MMSARFILGLGLLLIGVIWGSIELTRSGDIVMPGIMVVVGGMALAVEIARRRPGSIDD